jgi:hypothetical protein
VILPDDLVELNQSLGHLSGLTPKQSET